MENNQLQSFGPLQKLIEDDSIEEIWINTPNRVFVARGGKSELTINADGTFKEATSGLSKDYITEYSYGIAESFNFLDFLRFDIKADQSTSIFHLALGQCKLGIGWIKREDQ